MGTKKKRNEPSKQLFSNKTIIIIKIASACLLFFCCCWFFFANMRMFLDDLKKWNLFPIIFFSGLILICIYITNLVGHIESKQLYRAERFDIAYRIVFTITLLSLTIRALFVMPYSNTVPIIIVSLSVLSGIITWITPRIVDNNNDEF